MENNIIINLKKELYRMLDVQQAMMAAYIESTCSDLKEKFSIPPSPPLPLLPPKEKEEMPSEEEPERPNEYRKKKLYDDDDDDEEESDGDYNEDESYSSNEEIVIKKKKRSYDDDDDDPFIVSDDEEPIMYSDEVMNKSILDGIKKSMKNPIKRNGKKPRRFAEEKHKDTGGGSISCGDAIVEYDDVKEITNILKDCQSIESMDSFEFFIGNNPWWRTHFGNEIEAIMNNNGLSTKTSTELYDHIVKSIFLDKEKVSVGFSIYDRPRIKCSLCGLARKCDYDYIASNQEGQPIGNRCYPVVKFLITLFKTLKNNKGRTPEAVLYKLHVALTNLRHAHTNKSKRK